MHHHVSLPIVISNVNSSITDGHIECDDDSDVETCHGFLLAVYAHDLSGNKAQFFRRYQRERPDPVTIISDSDLEGKEFLKHAHSQLEQFHLYGNRGANYTPSMAYEVFQNAKPPEFAVLSTWDTAIPWAGGGWHSWTDLTNVEKAMKPLVDNNIFVVNEAYSLLQGWAEGTLKSADEILSEFFGVERPWSFPLVDMVQEIAQTASSECTAVVVEETVSSGGSGGAVAEENVLCFTADALVGMADGTNKPISQVMAGEFVLTGTDSGAGLVTQALIHPVNAIVPVAIVATPFGDLVGTPEHPVLINDEWLELGIIEGRIVTLSQSYVNAFYNLEIDGDVFEESSHSYVVNGIVASGLGDNKDLNRRYQRQQIWKDAVDNFSMK
jgi:Hint-domain